MNPPDDCDIEYWMHGLYPATVASFLFPKSIILAVALPAQHGQAEMLQCLLHGKQVVYLVLDEKLDNHVFLFRPREAISRTFQKVVCLVRGELQRDNEREDCRLARRVVRVRPDFREQAAVNARFFVGRIVKLSATILNDKPQMVFCNPGISVVVC